MIDGYQQPKVAVSDLRPSSWDNFRLDKDFADMTIEERLELQIRDPERYRRERDEWFGETTQKPFAEMSLDERTALYHDDYEEYQRQRNEWFGEDQ